MHLAVELAPAIVLAMTPTGPVPIHPQAYRPGITTPSFELGWATRPPGRVRIRRREESKGVPKIGVLMQL